MEYGMVGFDGLVGSSSGLSSTCTDHESKQKGSGSVCIKQERSEPAKDEPRHSKAAKASDFSSSTASLFQCKPAQQQHQQQMLSFSYYKPELSLLRNDGGLMDRSLQASMSPYFNHIASAYSKYPAGMNTAGVCFLDAVKGPFTPSQWVELEHQALIYKYMIANEPIPPNLLIPIRKAIEAAGFFGFRSHTLGWAPFQLGGYSSGTDPEPGRCRRTDGKKWRCTKDAVPDQKYCERHMNRGRHRSRKLVEAQSGHSVAGGTTNTTPVVSSSPALVVAGGGSTPRGFSISDHQVKNWQLGGSNSSASALMDRMLVNKESNNLGKQDMSHLSFQSPKINLNFRENSFSVPKQKMPYEEPAHSKFGVSSSLHPFMDEWPTVQADQSSNFWRELTTKSDRNQLSDFMSSTSSPTNETRSPPRQTVLNEPNHRHGSWNPISWETSLGGPLGEALNSTSSCSGDSRNMSTLNRSSAGSSPCMGNMKNIEAASLYDDIVGSGVAISSSLPVL